MDGTPNLAPPLTPRKGRGRPRKTAVPVSLTPDLQSLREMFVALREVAETQRVGTSKALQDINQRLADMRASISAMNTMLAGMGKLGDQRFEQMKNRVDHAVSGVTAIQEVLGRAKSVKLRKAKFDKVKAKP